ncbi:alpha/beta-hydrolase [Ascodesmis nigricans]|uniref:Pheromone-processing carboxypeptidase KEX1 n=1 Tax=Ascodesmis nigricans TaxID=341454 RepID=A0A4S2N0X5_9PEZI|nr:alpha/beta-hydrolase [Ascodesmis nigricans]
MTAAEYYVRDLPGAPDGGKGGPKMHAGHITVDPSHNGNLFFWHFSNKHIAQRPRTVIWLNGGPGCSSMDGALMEVGPYRVKDKDTLVHNPGAWNEFANLLFVDQPVGTGFSYVNTDAYLHELDEMAKHFIIFLEKFFDLFPHYEDDDLYFAGESYAGQHIPYIADAIIKRNAANPRSRPWNLKGLLIGNGWIDPEPQYLSYATFAYKSGILKKDSKEATSVENQVAICKKQIAEIGPKVTVDHCERVLQEILKKTSKEKDGKQMCYNMYDIRLHDTYPSCGMNWPPDLVNMGPYLRRKEVTQALHVSPGKKTGWQECSGSVGSAFNAENSPAAITLLPKILESVPVLLFSGDQDLICNHLGTEDSIHNMSWNGGKGFELSPGTWAPKEPWIFEGEPAGIYQSARNLTYVLFYNSSHMVPFDEPRRSRNMLDRFLGVDVDSRVSGGEKSPTVVGNKPDTTAADEAQEQRLKEERWAAYAKSGKIVLAIVIIAVVIWAAVIWRQRRRERRMNGGKEGYRGIPRREEMIMEEGREWDDSALELTHDLGDDSSDGDEGHKTASGSGSDSSIVSKDTKGKGKQKATV